MKKLLIALLMLPIALMATHTEPIPGKDSPEAIKHASLLELIQNQQFVLRSHTLYNRYGRVSFVSPSTNFFAVDSLEAVIQLAFENGQLGANGLGGVTLDGRLTRYEVRDRGVGKGVHVRITFFGDATIDLNLEVSEDGYAIIDMSSIRGSRLRMKGEIVPLAEADVYQGNGL